MTWLSHTSAGFFGFTPGRPPQPRWQGAKVEQLDIDEAFQEVADILEAFFAWRQWGDAPPFTGGVVDAWPARLADGLAFAKREWQAVQSHAQGVTHG